MTVGSTPRNTVQSLVQSIVGDEAEGGQPAFSNVQFLAGWNGANNSTTFTEESQNAQSSTFLGTTVLSTLQQKFGSAALLSSGANGGGVESPDLAVLTLGLADFCIEGFMRFFSLPSNNVAMTLMSHYEPNQNQRAWLVDIFNDISDFRLRFFYSTDGLTTVLIQSAVISPAPVTNTWYHIAETRQGDIQRGFFGGVQQGGNGDFSGDSIHNSTHVLTIGALGNSSVTQNAINGWIDESRLTVGEAVYTANFTPPTEAFPRS